MYLYSRQKAQSRKRLSIENDMLQLSDHVLAQRSFAHYQQAIERQFKEFFECERVTVVLVQRFKKFLFRICKDPITNEDYIKEYEFEHGFAGFVVGAGQTVQC